MVQSNKSGVVGIPAGMLCGQLGLLDLRVGEIDGVNVDDEVLAWVLFGAFCGSFQRSRLSNQGLIGAQGRGAATPLNHPNLPAPPPLPKYSSGAPQKRCTSQKMPFFFESRGWEGEGKRVKPQVPEASEVFFFFWGGGGGGGGGA